VRSLKALKSLGGGFGIVSVGSVQYVRSVPGELNLDKNRVLEVAQVCAVRWWYFVYSQTKQHASSYDHLHL
jgi:hypothetical protein